MSNAQPYETLARSIERELELMSQGAFGELDSLRRERAALIATLPATPPTEARPALRRALVLNQRLEAEILRRREAILLRLANTQRVERTARGYAAAAETL